MDKYKVLYVSRSWGPGPRNIVSYLMDGIKFDRTLEECENGYKYMDDWQDGTYTIVKQTKDNRFFGRSESKSNYHEWYEIKITKEAVIDAFKNTGYGFEKRCQALIDAGLSPELIPTIDPYIEYSKRFKRQ